MTELAALQELVGRAGSYAMLRFATATADPERGALLQKVQERGTQIETTLLFFELEWAALDDERAEELLASDGPRLLPPPPAHRALPAAPAVRAGGADPRREGAHQQQRVVAPVRGADRRDRRDAARRRRARRAGDRAVAPVLPDRDERRTTAEAVTAALEPGLRVRGYVLNTLLAEKMVDDRLRSYPHWLASRNLSNEASDESVEALIGGPRALRHRPPLVPAQGAAARHRPARRLRPHGRGDRRGRVDPVERAPRTWCWSRSPASPTAGGTARAFFDDRRIDAPVRPGKRGGAFCSYTVPSAAPYVMLNYTSRRRDVLTLAHELGHGVHAALARPQGVFHFATPLTLAETRERVRRDARLRAPAGGGADAGLAARPAGGEHRGLDRDRVPPGRDEPLRAPRHTARREQGELSLDRIGELWASRRRSCSATPSR